MGRPDYDDSVVGGDASSDYVHLLGDSTGSLTASGDRVTGDVIGTLQENDNGAS